MLVLVTGATGRIGTHVTQKLVAEGHLVRALAGRHHPRSPLIADAQVEFFPGRLEDREAMVSACRDVDVVFHLGAALTTRGKTDEEYLEVNVRGTFNLLMAVREQAPGLRRFIYASSDAVYYPGPM